MAPLTLCVAGGKGGVGKTFIATNLAYLARSRLSRVAILDADVDNPSVPAALGCVPNRVLSIESFVPRIDASRCRGCGRCVEYCPERALAMVPGKGPILLEDLCSGCRICQLVCPYGAISEGRRVEGWVGRCEAYGIDVIVGELAIGSRREAVVIKRLVDYASTTWGSYDVVVIDSPPGTGAKLYPLIKVSRVLIVVTEPTPLGLSDLLKFLQFLDRVPHEGRRVVVVINKAGVCRDLQLEIERIARERGYPCISVPYSDRVPRSISRGSPYVASERDEVSRALEEIFREALGR